MNNINIFKPDIRNHHIENLDVILLELNNVVDSDFIVSYIDELEAYISDYPDAVDKKDINALLEALKRRNLELNPEYQEAISYQEFVELFKKMYSGDNLSEEEKQKVDLYIDYSIRKLENDNILPEASNALDNYILYLKEKGISTKQIERYDKAVEKNKKENLKSGSGKKIYFIKKIDSQGRINTIATIEVTVLLGILISVLLLALR